jgi:hypothetical protein
MAPAHPVTEDVHPQRAAILRDAGIKLHHLEPRSVRRDPVNQGGSLEGMGSISIVNGWQWMLMDVNGVYKPTDLGDTGHLHQGKRNSIPIGKRRKTT